ncbi:MAG: flavodoxin [Ruminococcus sp.]|nr:flavodoxin [Ruminococcus sp.]
MNYTNTLKRALALTLSTAILTLSGCGNSDKPEKPAPKAEVSAINDGGEPSGSKILIAYFAVAENSDVDAEASASATSDGRGRMKAMADMIQIETGGDLFSIRTSVEYPGDGAKLIDYADKEQKDYVRPELTSHIENLDDYDVIFVGYPNWWFDMPMVMYSFFDEYDFSGKTIVPFNSHNGSGFSNTIKTIQSLEPDANVISDGFTVNEKDVESSAEDIAEWVNGLGYSKE